MFSLPQKWFCHIKRYAGSGGDFAAEYARAVQQSENREAPSGSLLLPLANLCLITAEDAAEQLEQPEGRCRFRYNSCSSDEALKSLVNLVKSKMLNSTANARSRSRPPFLP